MQCAFGDLLLPRVGEGGLFDLEPEVVGRISNHQPHSGAGMEKGLCQKVDRNKRRRR